MTSSNTGASWKYFTPSLIYLARFPESGNVSLGAGEDTRLEEIKGVDGGGGAAARV